VGVLGAVAAVASSLVAILVGFRLLRLGLASRRGPELVMGGAFLSIYVVGFPLAGGSRLPSLVGTPAGDAWFALGIGFVSLGLFGYSVFAWQVFRPGRGWAAACAAGSGLALATAGAHLVAAAWASSQLGATAVHDAARIYLVAGSLGFAACGFEGMHAWLLARRRLALGLADRAAVNRLGLFTGSALTNLAVMALVATCLGGGRAVVQMPLFQAIMTASNFAVACFWWLAFLPPARYLAWIRRAA
jgi:hypothetical protein